jgi:hypothetical protein
MVTHSPIKPDANSFPHAIPPRGTESRLQGEMVQSNIEYGDFMQRVRHNAHVAFRCTTRFVLFAAFDLESVPMTFDACALRPSLQSRPYETDHRKAGVATSMFQTLRDCLVSGVPSQDSVQTNCLSANSLHLL